MMLNRVAWVLLIVGIWARPIFAGTLLTGVASESTRTTSSLGGSSYIPVATTGSTTSSSTGIQSNGSAAANQQNSGQLAATIAAGAMAALAAATCPSCSKRGTCGVCYGSMAGAAASLLAASQMKNASDTSDTQVTDVNPTSTTATASTLSSTDTLGTVKTLKSAAKSVGATAASDGTSVTLADGTNLATSALASTPMSSAEKAMMNAALAKAKGDIEKLAGKDGGASSVLAESEVGGNAGLSAAQVAKADSQTSTAKSLRNPASVAGTFKNFNGDKIGVAQDSLFEMMHRRYQLHSRGGSLIQEK